MRRPQRWERYRRGARFYDLISAEPVYRAGRRIGIGQLALRPGDTVVDIGCGTGLNFELLEDVIGPTGRLVGVDRSGDMLAQARRRVQEHGWGNVELLHADATTVAAATVIDVARRRADAVLATYSLSLMQDWRAAWVMMLAVAARPSRLCVVDMQPTVGAAVVLGWLARLTCLLAGADINARPWRAVEADCDHVLAAAARGGHIQVRTGAARANRTSGPDYEPSG